MINLRRFTKKQTNKRDTFFHHCVRSVKGHVRYINILTWLRGFRVKIVNFLSCFCLFIPRRDSDTKKTTPNIDVVLKASDWAMLQYWYIKSGLFITDDVTMWYSRNKKVADEAMAECVTDVLTAFWRLLWSITESDARQHGIYLFYMIKN